MGDCYPSTLIQVHYNGGTLNQTTTSNDWVVYMHLQLFLILESMSQATRHAAIGVVLLETAGLPHADAYMLC